MNRVTACALLALLAACGGPAPTPDSMNDPSLLRMELAPYTLQPGEEKNYVCTTMMLPADKETVITEVIPTYGPGIHHVAIYQPIALEKMGSFDCPELTKNTWIPLYVTGVDSGPLKIPAGSALRLPAGSQILVQLHLQNVSARPISASSAVLFRTVDAATAVQQAGIFGFDFRGISIPARGRDIEQGMSCTMTQDKDVFAVLGHMHKRGQRIELSRGQKAGDEVLYAAKWSFQDQPTVPYQMKVRKGDKIHLRCWFDNDLDKPLSYGESSDTEMCSFVLYHTPSDGVDGCIAQ